MKKRMIKYQCLYFIAFIVGGIILLPLRTVQLQKYTNAETGFYNGPEYLVTSLYILLLLLLIIFFIIAVFDKKRNNADYYTFDGIPMGFMNFFSVLSGVAVLYYFTNSLSLWVQSKTLLSFAPIVCILSLLTVGSFFYLPYKFLKRRDSIADILLFFPCLWNCALLLSMFLQHIVVVTILENTINILRLALQVFYFIAFTKLLLGYQTSKTYMIYMVSGMMTILLNLLSFLPFVLQIFGQPCFLSAEMITVIPTEIVITAFIFVASLFIKPKKHE